MSSQEPDFMKDYIEWIKDNSAQRFVNGYTEITTPFLDSHNDAIQFYVKREGDSFLFTDDGYTFADIEMNGLNLNTKKRKELVQYLVESMNVSVENGAIIAKASSSTLVAQNAFGLNLIITTHSVDFLTAIDYFSTKYQIRDNCHFYLTETEKISDSESMARVSFRNVNKEMETMYTSISEPYLRI